MKTFVLALVMTMCPDVQIENDTGIWNDRDRASLSAAQRGCHRFYSKDHCLIKFHKTDVNQYRATCGRR